MSGGDGDRLATAREIALDAMQLVRGKAFIRVRDKKFIELVNRAEKGLKRSEPEALFRAESLHTREVSGGRKSV